MRLLLKKAIMRMHAYGILPDKSVAWLFDKFRLRSE